MGLEGKATRFTGHLWLAVNPAAGGVLLACVGVGVGVALYRPRSRSCCRWSTAVWQLQMQRERQPPAGGSWASNGKPVAETRMGWHGRVLGLGLGLPLPACCMVIGSGGSGTSVPASGPRRPRGPVVSALPNHRWAQILCLSPAQGLHGPWPVLSFETSRPGLLAKSVCFCAGTAQTTLPEARHIPELLIPLRSLYASTANSFQCQRLTHLMNRP